MLWNGRVKPHVYGPVNMSSHFSGSEEEGKLLFPFFNLIQHFLIYNVQMDCSLVQVQSCKHQTSEVTNMLETRMKLQGVPGVQQ